jgi:hypothetical protein
LNEKGYWTKPLRGISIARPLQIRSPKVAVVP